MSLATPGPRLTGALLVSSAVVVNAAFLGLGVVFDYPDVLQQPGLAVLQRFAEAQLLVAGLFALLALGAAALAPIAVGLSRLAAGSAWARAAVVTGVAAAVVQAAGLLRWPLLVPGLAATATDPDATPESVRAAVDEFDLLGRVLGGVVGEAAGYVLTAAFTGLVVVALGRRWRLSRGSTAAALASVPMILAGLLMPAGVGSAGLVNFAGYVLWSAWLIALGVRLLRAGTPGAPLPVDGDSGVVQTCG